jgi:NTE family protein
MTSGQAIEAKYQEKVLLLQGGGALGAYQAGAYEALDAGNHTPTWVVGVSIGAINASIIAGNAPEHRVSRLREFWHRVTSPTAPLKILPLTGAIEKTIGAAGAVFGGQPGFFRPWWPLDWMLHPPASFYDTSGLEKTLCDLINFDLLNRGDIRLSVGAVHVETGNNLYFDNAKTEIGPQHIMASGALPPGFPAVSVDGEAYWDGGLVSNTPLTYFMDHQPRRDSLVFQVDLFPSRGKIPRMIDEVGEREKDIRYSSRTRLVTTTETRQQNLRRQAGVFLDKLPPELKDDPVARRMRAWACPARIDLVHLIYRPKEAQGSQKDYQFARAAIEQRWADGYADAGAAVAAAPWLAPYPEAAGMRTFDVATGQEKT